MALSKDQIDILADKYIVSLFQGMESEVINDIARRVNKEERFTETAEIQARNMRELGFSTSKIQTEVMKKLNADPEYKKTIAENTREYKAEIKEIIKETVAQAKQNGEDMIAQAGDMAWNDDLQLWSAHDVDLKKPSTLSQLKKAFTKQTNGSLKNISQTTAFVGTVWGKTGVINAYQRAMDMTVLKVATGNFGYKQAIVDTIKDLSKGLATVDYASGRKYHVDTAARMTARTAISQLAGKITEANLEATDAALVYVDAHPGARPSHAAWQGKAYTYKGKASKKYPDFYKETQYGEITGLKGVNCTHNFYPYWDGDPIPEFKEPDPVEVDGKTYTYYEAAQKQRGMERNIRETKRQLNAMRSLNDPSVEEDIQKAEASLQTQTKKYNAFSKAAGVEAQPDKLKVYDSIATAKTAARAALTPQYGERIVYDSSQPFKLELEGYDKKINAKLTKAAKKVAKLSGEDGCEHGVFVDLDKPKIYRYMHGDPDSVFPDYKFLTQHPEINVAFIHSHTKATLLSYHDADILINNKEISVMAAVRADGPISVIESNGVHTDQFVSQDIILKNRAEYSKLEYNECDKFIIDKMSEKYLKGKMNVYNDRK